MNTDEIRGLRDYIEEYKKCFDVDLFFIKRGVQIIDGLDNALDEIDNGRAMCPGCQKRLEQQAQKACIEAGWEWIRDHGHTVRYGSRQTFKQAIDSVGEGII